MAVPVAADEDYPKVIGRNAWKSQPPKFRKPMDTPVGDVVYTETDTKPCFTKQECIKRVQQIQRYHMEAKGMPDIQHNFLIGGDGNIYVGRGWWTEGPEYPKNHKIPKEMTGKSVEVAFIGEYKDNDPTPEMIEATKRLIRFGLENRVLDVTKSQKKSTS
ncbi:peptidoglycan-recognition protein LF-like [Macrosteles quadrilineatus]|uniref:peptidoglycan-recognition protein LF-like n=1 Tax=Macrosteles quadrilineatus TaxID=74068 RepID=UPI0023E32119|nr:peptidoglycan-recognition protein LF-like [Macrosteles quadrilineatus]XP_054261659.1 peptidoglycan-recognition protein LF-like [Macrosteles quadrilineatus]